MTWAAERYNGIENEWMIQLRDCPNGDTQAAVLKKIDVEIGRLRGADDVEFAGKRCWSVLAASMMRPLSSSSGSVATAHSMAGFILSVSTTSSARTTCEDCCTRVFRRLETAAESLIDKFCVYLIHHYLNFARPVEINGDRITSGFLLVLYLWYVL